MRKLFNAAATHV